MSLESLGSEKTIIWPRDRHSFHRLLTAPQGALVCRVGHGVVVGRISSVADMAPEGARLVLSLSNRRPFIASRNNQMTLERKVAND